MANAKKCDRCGKFYTDTSAEDIAKKFINNGAIKLSLFNEIITFSHMTSSIRTGAEEKTIDLCPSCMEELQEFLRGDKNDCKEM